MRQQFKTACLLTVIFTLSGAVPFEAWQTSAQTSGVKVSLFQFPEILQKAPVAVIAVDAQGGRLQLGRAHRLSGRWLDDFTVTVENISAKTIRYIELRVELSGGKGKFPIIPIFAGNEGHLAPTVSTRVEGGDHFAPGSSARISAKTACEALYKVLDEMNLSLADVSDVVVRVDMVLFDDNTGWAQGYPVMRDPANPNAWLRSDEEAVAWRREERNSFKASGAAPSFLKTGSPQESQCWVFQSTETVNCTTGTGCTARPPKLVRQRDRWYREDTEFLCRGGTGCTGFITRKDILYLPCQG